MYARCRQRQSWGAVIALLLSASLVVGFAPSRSDARQQYGPRLQMLSLTNTDRHEHERRPLDFNARISRYAKQHTRDMAHKGYLFHSDDNTLRDVLAPYDWTIGGENVGVGGSLESLESAFMHSKEHRDNILRPEFDHMAVGIVRDEGKIWVTVIFYG